MIDLFNLNQLEQQLGPLSYPLLACSLIVVAILVERLSVLSFFSLSGALGKKSQAITAHHQAANRELREEVAAIWLQRQQTKLAYGIRVLNIISILAPLLGLLGTVIGLIQVFDELGVHQGPIEPSMLAGGLGIAMKTTAAGLIIALPAVLGAHGFQRWVERLIHQTEHAMNVHDLELEGICTKAIR